MLRFNDKKILLVLFIAMGLQNILTDQVCARDIEIGLAALHVDGHLPNNEEIQSFEKKLQRRIATIGWFMGIGENEQEGSPFPGELLLKDYKPSQKEMKPIIPMVTLEPWGPWKKDSDGHDEGPLHRINQGKMDDYFRKLASEIKQFGEPIRVRFAHEMIQNDVPEYRDSHPGWYPWQDEPEEYIKAFKRLVRIFKEEKANNAQFVWSPNFHMYDYTILAKYYPGPDIVDWIGLDGYNWSGQDFDGIFNYLYRALTGHPEIFGDKPIMIAEFAMAENLSPKISKADWIKDAFSKMKTAYPKIKAFYWFQLNKEHDWRLDSSDSSWQAFKESMGDPAFISR